MEDFLALSKPKVILFTDKKQTPSIYKAISKDWKDKVELGEVKSIEKDIAGKFGVSEFPTLIGIVDSVSLEYKVYDG